MQNLYPLFERNRILKKEMLWSLRDYSFAHIQIEYQEYGQGIIRGCDIRVDGDELAVGPGILKYGRFICLMMEEEKVPYHAADRMQYLKLRIDADSLSPDYIAYRMELASDLDEKKKENEFELCRFHLRSGARLRDHYKDFSDMGTEYDTVNLIHADWADWAEPPCARRLPGVLQRLFSQAKTAGWKIVPLPVCACHRQGQCPRGCCRLMPAAEAIRQRMEQRMGE